MTTLAEFERLLQQAIGLDPASVGPSVITRAVRERQRACGFDGEQRYLAFVRSSKAELQELIEAVVVPETWFFRQREAFAALASAVNSQLRLLSLPCSSGEEPYSMVMALLDAGFPASRFRVDAMDISARAIEKAQRAVYGKNSFRSSTLNFRERYFTAADGLWHLSEAVRKHVHFHQANLLDPEALPGSEIYDIIFCRNLLIYFDTATQDRAVHALRRLLTAQGLLFVGPSETGLLLNHGFVSAKIPHAFAFRKPSRTLGHPSPAPRKKRPPHRVHAVPSPAPAPKPSSPAIAPAIAPRTHSAPGFDAVEKLADTGKLTEAAIACENFLRDHGPSAGAFHLLGVIYEASGNDTAASEYYRKTLYLDPQHEETLAHLAFLLEKQGDAQGARVLRQRLQRLEKKRAPGKQAPPLT